ncbi:hypothetical protein [Pelotomaculum propionicicum]|uniref:Uncharacterized protein n=1 Tax=Pelotomaculum propionicicum TaxID=258475 RepID=A0A4Y7RYE3_9FIRM|nr:hypothetical protein [Pelotomaculum propionicicum]TEB13337.1 hypothetical protein Pmgp_00231 [Pelotomaculum propionicicum]
MRKYEVGKLFAEEITSYPETVKFDFTQSGPVLLVFFAGPTPKEIESVKSGRFEAGFYAKDDVIFFLARFAGLNWMDAPYTAHLSEPFEFLEMGEGQGFGLHIFLVDARTGIIKAMRLIGLSAGFSRKLKTAIEDQKKRPFNKDVYDHQIKFVFSNFTTMELVQRADARCRIG